MDCQPKMDKVFNLKQSEILEQKLHMINKISKMLRIKILNTFVNCLLGLIDFLISAQKLALQLVSNKY
ncbi:hypothetical protein BpHYR1_041453 [Brachionus plicatilis]|uniref:Uncharacterized protein n=1 Tax=Brachionus plicatilis TaxID=10195 RepID=A0A3M7SWK4_BRAPC|nr:hypothetical protein BpHYR1_041453 [Brachionus plicatilis]